MILYMHHQKSNPFHIYHVCRSVTLDLHHLNTQNYTGLDYISFYWVYRYKYITSNNIVKKKRHDQNSMNSICMYIEIQKTRYMKIQVVKKRLLQCSKKTDFTKTVFLTTVNTTDFLCYQQKTAFLVISNLECTY